MIGRSSSRCGAAGTTTESSRTAFIRSSARSRAAWTWVAASDFSLFSITAPTDARLPNGGGYAISGLYDLNPSKFGVPAQNVNTFSDQFGSQTEHWNGVDVSANMRARGLLLQGGISTGRTVTDNCQIVAALPSLLTSGSTVTPLAYCHANSGFITRGTFLAAYTFPRINLLVSAAFQSVPGPAITGNFVASNALIAPSLGRNLSAGTTSNDTINLVAPGALYGERMNQLDLRVGKRLRLGSMRLTPNFDLYNVTNADTVITENANYSAFRVPTSVLNGRLAKVSVQWDF